MTSADTSPVLAQCSLPAKHTSAQILCFSVFALLGSILLNTGLPGIEPCCPESNASVPQSEVQLWVSPVTALHPAKVTSSP